LPPKRPSVAIGFNSAARYFKLTANQGNAPEQFKHDFAFWKIAVFKLILFQLPDIVDWPPISVGAQDNYSV
jgi:hypothetical protein